VRTFAFYINDVKFEILRLNTYLVGGGLLREIEPDDIIIIHLCENRDRSKPPEERVKRKEEDKSCIYKGIS